MTPEAQRIAIAKICGWKREKTPFERHSTRIEGMKDTICDQAWWHPAVAGCSLAPPNYPFDLNAMQEVEKTLDALDNSVSSRPQDYATLSFVAELRKIVGAELREIVTNDGMSTFVDSSPFEEIKMVRATAAQRAEAFLRALNLWDDAK